MINIESIAKTKRIEREMEKENLTPALFVEKWLPDFDKRRKENHIRSMTGEDGRLFAEEVFPDALAAFEVCVW